MDGKPRAVTLTDLASGVEIARRICAWSPPQPSFQDLQGFLRASMTQPIILQPFLKEHKRVFAEMDEIADRLCANASALAEPPLVSVIMPVFNRASILSDAIRSVIAQDYQHFELLVVDDGSSDASAAVAEGFDDPRVRVIRLDRNSGHSVARNTGLASSRGAILAYLDSDNHWDKRYLGAVVGAFENLPTADALYSAQWMFQGTAIEPFGIRYGQFDRALLENRNYIDLNAFAHRRELIERMGNFDTDLHRFVDYDLILRASEVGRMVSVPVLLSHYVYDKVENTVTKDERYENAVVLVRQRLEARRLKRLAQMALPPIARSVSVVILSQRGMIEDLQDCLAALDAQHGTDGTGQGPLEIIVVDSFSSHQGGENLQALAAAGRITLIENAHGLADAANRGIACTRGNTDILLLSADAILDRGALQILQQAAYCLPQAGMTVPRRVMPGGTETIANHVPFATPTVACCINISAIHNNVGSVPIFHDGSPLELSHAPSSAVYLRRDMLTELGLSGTIHDVEYPTDRVYCDKMRSVTGRRLYYVPEASAVHKRRDISS